MFPPAIWENKMKNIPGKFSGNPRNFWKIEKSENPIKFLCFYLLLFFVSGILK